MERVEFFRHFPQRLEKHVDVGKKRENHADLNRPADGEMRVSQNQQHADVRHDFDDRKIERVGVDDSGIGVEIIAVIPGERLLAAAFVVEQMNLFDAGDGFHERRVDFRICLADIVVAAANGLAEGHRRQQKHRNRQEREYGYFRVDQQHGD